MRRFVYTVYVLQDKDGHLYKGMTNDLDRRLKEHALGKTQTARRMNQLVVVYTKEVGSREEARKHELYLKTSAGRRYLHNILRS
ncbi:MAG: GIY-YIG domain protein [Candidatus Giovannonibacteria bacterium GW2011_GWA2_53_7]|uniref:GIY-YIG domain protein n=1 Tax=Candidatus Giovannonibacteria bacterium GW2011_GWA2_53_7 TaxID=1618650 RepID=A0A0G1Y117_9BACT|nr:MAG: GIY-YIG domain protein [Candidatus Giovannonibacteria bacterium GW2011_GWA2_53_7]